MAFRAVEIGETRRAGDEGEGIARAGSRPRSGRMCPVTRKDHVLGERARFGAADRLLGEVPQDPVDRSYGLSMKDPRRRVVPGVCR